MRQRGPLSDGPEGVTKTVEYYKNCDNTCWSCGYDILKHHHSGNRKRKKKSHIDQHTGDNPAAGASIKDKEFSKWALWRWRLQLECKPTNIRSSLAHNLLHILIRQSYCTKPTVIARPKGTWIRFSDTISIATPIESNHHILREVIERMQTQYKNTQEKVRSIYPSLVWHDNEKKKKKEKKIGTTKFERKAMLSALPGIAAQKTITQIDSVSKLSMV